MEVSSSEAADCINKETITTELQSAPEMIQCDSANEPVSTTTTHEEQVPTQCDLDPLSGECSSTQISEESATLTESKISESDDVIMKELSVDDDNPLAVTKVSNVDSIEHSNAALGEENEPDVVGQSTSDSDKVGDLSSDVIESMDSQEEEKEIKEKDIDSSLASSLLDENSEELESKPIEEVDPESKDDSNDESPDLGASDPLMKDAELQAGEDDPDDSIDEPTEELDVKPVIAENDPDSDRILLSVKPPGELLEGNFVDVAEEDSMPEDSQMDFDPIETNNEQDRDQDQDPDDEQDTELDNELDQEQDEQEQDSQDTEEESLPIQTDIFNGKEAETILAEDDDEDTELSQGDTTLTAEGDDQTSAGDENKFIITMANRTENSKCNICNNEEIPKYLAHKNEECECICSNACLDKFKEEHADDYIERILRLRVFATEERETREPSPPPPALMESDDDEGRDPFRKCVKCKRCIDVEDFVTWEAQEYCDEACLAESQRGINNDCAKCQHRVPEYLLGKYCVRFGTTVTQFCKTSCLISYKKARKLCQFCQEDLKDDDAAMFCSKRCKEAATPNESEPKESAPCAVCGQVKEVELNVRGDSKMDPICSERCLVAYKFVNKVELVKCVVCPTTFSPKPGDPTVYEPEAVHSLCSKECQKIFLITHRKIVNCNMCMVKKYDFDMIRYVENSNSTCVCSLTCLSVYYECRYSQNLRLFEPNLVHLELISNGQNYIYKGRNISDMIDATHNVGKMNIQMVVVTKPRFYPKQKNKAVMCRPRMMTKAIQHKIKERSVHIQTDDTTTRWIPIPVPIFVPSPLHMYAQPIPMPTPIPIPLIIPIFILTGRRSMKGIQKEIAKIKNRIPADPLEAEILMMADMAAGDKRNEPTSDSDDEVKTVQDTTKMLDTSIATMDSASTSFSDDVLSMALKMANEYTEPLDLESEVDNSSRLLNAGRRPRMYPRGRPSQRMIELAKPDENLSLKYTFGVNAWKQWATNKNLELQKLKSTKFVKLDLMQLSAEDLCFCLCQFVKEVRKPNGAVYASDTIYYLCLGLQLYLYENGRIDNLFCDPYYEKFTDTFNEICLSFCQLYNDNQYIVTRVEEEHLWESKQLGAHSPLVLLNTLLFFNTKHFNLTTVDDHLQLSFSHIMKHWKRNANAPNQRNVLLRFYPPSKGAWGKRKVYEQQECLDNPLRCPVRLYEFFLSKCPESVKTRNDVFYLQPERSCVPDSPVWYSTSPLDRVHLEKMLNRMKMIKEISMAILGT